MTAYLILMGSLALFHATSLLLNTVHVRMQRLHGWLWYVLGWAAAAAAATLLATFPYGPQPALWSTHIGLSSLECYKALMSLYVFCLIECLAQYFMREATYGGASRSFIAYVARLVLGVGSKRETIQLIGSSEYSVFGVCGASLLLPFTAATGSDPLNRHTARLALSAAGLALASMGALWSLRRWVGEPRPAAPLRFSGRIQ